MKYRLSAMMTVSAWTEVEAETEEEAIKIASDREPGGLCSNAIYPDDGECWHFDSDGMPQGISVDE